MDEVGMTPVIWIFITLHNFSVLYRPFLFLSAICVHVSPFSVDEICYLPWKSNTDWGYLERFSNMPPWLSTHHHCFDLQMLTSVHWTEVLRSVWFLEMPLHRNFSDNSLWEVYHSGTMPCLKFLICLPIFSITSNALYGFKIFFAAQLML